MYLAALQHTDLISWRLSNWFSVGSRQSNEAQRVLDATVTLELELFAQILAASVVSPLA